MFGTRRGSEGKPGGSAEDRFKTLVRAWRKRRLRPVLLVCIIFGVAFRAAGYAVSGDMKFWFGTLMGSVMAVYIALRDSPPNYIEKWRMGFEGEKQTAKELKRLSKHPDWFVRHDIVREDRANRDHVAVGPAGVFLMDSKNFSGIGSVESDGLHVRQVEDPADGWTCEGLGTRMRAWGAELGESIRTATDVAVWVQPVVVLWMDFPPKVLESSGVFYVEGKSLGDWLAGRPLSKKPFDSRRVVEFLRSA